jgi:UDP-3-O-[3-hydroxymyristoyl] glucosamine N-acyltransferase
VSGASRAPARTLGEIARVAEASIEGSPDTEIRGVAGLEDAESGDVSFLAHPRYESALASTRATAVILAPGVPCPKHVQALRAKDPYGALARILSLFEPPGGKIPPGVHPSAVIGSGVTFGEGVRIGPGAVIDEGARIGARCTIGAGAVVGAGAVLGDDCLLHPRAVIAHGCILGRRVIVHPGAVIGADGFGYAMVGGAYAKIPQIGIVEIGDDVEIGANSCIDRATIGRTRIGSGTKIDNLVQVAHNVAIGEGCALAGQSGVAGSARIGDGVRIGGQTGISGHIRIGDGVTVGGRSGVIGDLSPGETVSGFPARSHRETMRIQACLHKLPEMLRRLRILESGREVSSSGTAED